MTFRFASWGLILALVVAALTPGAALCRCVGHADGACRPAPVESSCCHAAAAPTPAPSGMVPGCPCGAADSLDLFIPVLQNGESLPDAGTLPAVAPRRSADGDLSGESRFADLSGGAGPPRLPRGSSIEILRI